MNIAFLSDVFSRNKEIVILDDETLYKDKPHNAAEKRMALEAVIGFIARTIIQSEFRVKDKKKVIKNKVFYKLNIKPNKNQSASVFWNEVIHKLIYDGECLIIKSRDDDFLIADDFVHNELAVKEDKFSNVYVKGLELSGVFPRSEVIYLEYGNSELSKLVDSLFYDYGELMGRMFESMKLKGQIRSTVDVESSFLKTEEGQSNLQKFINKAYKAIKEKSIAIVPQQKGLTYSEHSKQGNSTFNVEELNKLSDGFLDKVCYAVGLPPNLLKGDIADLESATKNGMKFCIDPIIKIISDELNRQLFYESEYLEGQHIQIKRISSRDMFDVATAIDKLRSSSVADGHELRDEIGLEHSDDPIHDEFVMTKNYTTLEGGE